MMMSPQGGFTRRGDGWWSGRSRGWSSDAACALAGRRRLATGWRSLSLPAPISCSIWRFSDRVLGSGTGFVELGRLSARERIAERPARALYGEVSTSGQLREHPIGLLHGERGLHRRLHRGDDAAVLPDGRQ